MGLADRRTTRRAARDRRCVLSRVGHRGALGIAALGIALAACRAILGIDDPTLLGADAGPDAPETGVPPPPPSDASGDADADAARLSCAHDAPFGAGRLVFASASEVVWSARFSVDERRAFLAVSAGPGATSVIKSYAHTNGSLNTPSPLTGIDTAGDEYWPTTTPDGKLMFFEGPELTDGGGTSRIWIAQFEPATSGYTNPKVHAYFAGIPSAVTIGAPFLTPSGSLVFASTRRDVDEAGVRPDGGADSLDLWIANISLSSGDFSASDERVLDELATDDGEQFPVLTADGAEIFFTRPPDDTGRVFRALRGDGGRFGAAAPVALPWDGSDAGDLTGTWTSHVSGDACRLYVLRHRAGYPRELWVAERQPPK